MRELVQKFSAIEAELADEKGDLLLFALFERDDTLGKWDVVISAPWIGESKRSTLDYVVQKVKSKLTTAEIVSLSRIVLLEPSEEFVNNVNNWIDTVHSPVELQNFTLNGMSFARAYIITSHRGPVARALTSAESQA